MNGLKREMQKKVGGVFQEFRGGGGGEKRKNRGLGTGCWVNNATQKKTAVEKKDHFPTPRKSAEKRRKGKARKGRGKRGQTTDKGGKKGGCGESKSPHHKERKEKKGERVCGPKGWGGPFGRKKGKKEHDTGRRVTMKTYGGEKKPKEHGVHSEQEKRKWSGSENERRKEG